MAPLDRVSDCTDAAGAEDVEQPKLKRSTSIGQDLGTSPIRGLDPRMGYSGWNALKFDVGVGVACCAVMKLLPRLLKLPLINEAFVRRILYVMLGSRVAVLAMWDVARYQCRLISGRWKDDETLHGRRIYGWLVPHRRTVDRGLRETVSYRNARGFFQILG